MVAAENLYLASRSMALATEELHVGLWNCVCKYIIITHHIIGWNALTITNTEVL
jgi:hypothetical protein